MEARMIFKRAMAADRAVVTRGSDIYDLPAGRFGRHAGRDIRNDSLPGRKRMKYRRLGGTDLDVSVVCLGPMRAAAKEPGDDEKSRLGELALRQALDAGVNFLHSSYEYGTRWMMSRVLKDHPKRGELHHVIKVPVPAFQDGD